MCGWDENPAVSMHQNKFSRYVQPDTKERVIFNENTPEFTTNPAPESNLKPVTYIREDLWLAKNPKDKGPDMPPESDNTKIIEAPKVAIFGKSTPPIPQPNVKNP
jgi:hypothetical protein